MNRVVCWVFKVGFIGAFLASCSTDPEDLSSPAPGTIFGNPDYRAISFGGYRGLTREDGPTVEQLIDDVKILAAMDIKLLRTLLRYEIRTDNNKSRLKHTAKSNHA